MSNAPEVIPSALATKRTLTTGEAALVCKVSQQTIIRCFDNGRLQGFRVPGSKFRRIPREELIKFMRKSEIPIPLEFLPVTIVVFDPTPDDLAGQLSRMVDASITVTPISRDFDLIKIVATNQRLAVVLVYPEVDERKVELATRLVQEGCSVIVLDSTDGASLTPLSELGPKLIVLNSDRSPEATVKAITDSPTAKVG